MLTDAALADFVLHAYQPERVFVRWVRSLGRCAERPIYKNYSGDRICSFLWRGVRHVAFPGSDHPLDWASNIFAVQARIKLGTQLASPYGMVHAGLEASYRDIHDWIPKDGLVWCGHSRGSYFAARGALEYAGRCVTFGSPRCFGPDAADWFNRQIDDSRRFAFASDLVTRLPTRKYKHVKGLIRLPGWVPRHSMSSYLSAVRLLQ